MQCSQRGALEGAAGGAGLGDEVGEDRAPSLLAVSQVPLPQHRLRPPRAPRLSRFTI